MPHKSFNIKHYLFHSKVNISLEKKALEEACVIHDKKAWEGSQNALHPSC